MPKEKQTARPSMFWEPSLHEQATAVAAGKGHSLSQYTRDAVIEKMRRDKQPWKPVRS